MPERQIQGRCFYIGRGKKTVTVNICDQNKRRGDYDWIVRVFRPQDVTEEEVTRFSEIQDLVIWLKAEKGGVLEKHPPHESHEDPGIKPERPPVEDLPWIDRAVAIVELCLDELVEEFLRAPWLHRVEHSLHARLFALLAAHPHLSAELPLLNGELTQPVHKEWPETVPSPGTRRGNFDIAILSPTQLARTRVDDFWRGNIPAPIVIELGVDYGEAHLGQDADKLLQSDVLHGYLVHFRRRPISDKERELIEAPGGDTKVAFACSAGPGSFKKVGDPAIQTRG